MARDTNIGVPTAINLARGVDVQNFENVIAAIKTVTHELEEAVEELKKIRTGTGLILDGEIEEAE